MRARSTEPASRKEAGLALSGPNYQAILDGSPGIEGPDHPSIIRASRVRVLCLRMEPSCYETLAARSDHTGWMGPSRAVLSSVIPIDSRGACTRAAFVARPDRALSRPLCSASTINICGALTSGRWSPLAQGLRLCSSAGFRVTVSNEVTSTPPRATYARSTTQLACRPCSAQTFRAWMRSNSPGRRATTAGLRPEWFRVTVSIRSSQPKV